MIQNVPQVIVSRRSRDAQMKLKVRTYGLLPTGEMIAEGIQRPPHLMQMLLLMPDGRQCGGFRFNTNPEFQHGQHIADCSYRPGLDPKVRLVTVVQNERSDSMMRSHDPGRLEFRDRLPHNGAAHPLLADNLRLRGEFLAWLNNTAIDHMGQMIDHLLGQVPRTSFSVLAESLHFSKCFKLEGRLYDIICLRLPEPLSSELFSLTSHQKSGYKDHIDV